MAYATGLLTVRRERKMAWHSRCPCRAWRPRSTIALAGASHRRTAGSRLHPPRRHRGRIPVLSGSGAVGSRDDRLRSKAALTGESGSAAPPRPEPSVWVLAGGAAVSKRASVPGSAKAKQVGLLTRPCRAIGVSCAITSGSPHVRSRFSAGTAALFTGWRSAWRDRGERSTSLVCR